MPFIEAPTTFYLGRRYDNRSNQLVDDIVYYDSRDLVTHAIVVGMTGSGKTGLCIVLLEEAVMDNIPALIIDPKGDITNLLLAFPNLAPEEFMPWVNEDDARRAGLEPHEYARDIAQRWRDGLKSWGITPQRVAEFRQRAYFSIFTPGSDAGLPISIMDALQPPREGWHGYEEQHRERISGIVTALLGLTGMRSASKDREHVLIANIIEHAWAQGLPLTIADIIVQVQQPPFSKLGVFDVNTFFPEKDRFKLAIELNNIIASPSFKTWLQGEPLDVRNLLYMPDGRPRVSIFYIAHLTEEQRSFIITLLLENVLAWMRTLGGTSSLRAILYFDEVFGHFPPYPKNPPTKEPLLRLLKQARAFGIGLVLATQNPGDLDYKGLSNAGTWFLGKLQTENDKRKVLDGLATASSADQNLNMSEVDELLSTIQPRVFIMNNVHESGGPILLHTRWAMSYLRGPMTRQQVSQLMVPQKQQQGYTGSYGQASYQQAPAQQQQYQSPPPAASQPLQGVTGANYGGATPPPLPEMPPAQAPGGFSQPGSTPPPPPSLPGFTDRQTPPPPPDLPGFGTVAQPSIDPSRFQGAAPTPPPLPPQQNYGQPGYPQQQPGYPQQQAGYPQQPPQQQPSAPQQAVQVVQQNNGLPSGYSNTPPALSKAVPQYYLPANIPTQQAIAYLERNSGVRIQQVHNQTLLYQPFLLVQVQVRFMDRKMSINIVETFAYHIPNVERSGLIQWEEYQARPMDPRSVQRDPVNEAAYGELPPGLIDQKRMNALEKEIVDYIYKTAYITVPVNEALKIYGDPNAPLSDFQARLYSTARTQRDEELDKMTQKYAAQFDKLEERYRNKQREIDANKDAISDLNKERLATMGEAAVSLFQGRAIYTLSRVSRVSRFQEQAKHSLTDNEAELIQLQEDMNKLQYQFEQDIHGINEKWQRIVTDIREDRVTPYKKDIHMELFGIGWKPFYYLVTQGGSEMLPAWQGQVTPQFDMSQQSYTQQRAFAQPMMQQLGPGQGYPQQPAAPYPPQGQGYPQQPAAYPPQGQAYPQQQPAAPYPPQQMQGFAAPPPAPYPQQPPPAAPDPNYNPYLAQQANFGSYGRYDAPHGYHDPNAGRWNQYNQDMGYDMPLPDAYDDSYDDY